MAYSGSVFKLIYYISEETEFNGIKLLDGSLSGTHDGTGLNSTGSMKIHFGTGNDSAEDYYYINIGNAGLEGLGLGTTIPGHISSINDLVPNDEWEIGLTSGVVPYAYISRGSKNVTIQLDAHGDHIAGDISWDDDIALFTRNGTHIAGYPIGSDPSSTNPNSNDWAWSTNGINIGNVNDIFITEANGFYSDAKYDSSQINSGGTTYSPNSGTANTIVNGMNISSGGDGNWYDSTPNDREVDPNFNIDYVNIDNVTEDLLLFSIGSVTFAMNVAWNDMTDVRYSTINGMQIINIETQEAAQKAIPQINDAIVIKDNIRAHLGAMQNRLEVTIDNLTLQAENLQASESRISDTDVGIEMTNLVRNQILAQSAVAMLSQANSLPKMAQQLIGG